MGGLIFSYALGYLSMAVFPLWIGGVASHYGLSLGTAGLISSAEIGAVALTAFLLPAIMQQVNLRRLSLLSNLGLVVLNVISIHPGSIYALLLCRVLVGVCDGAILAIATALAGRTDDPHKAFATLQVAQVISAMLFYAVSAELVTHFGAVGVFVYYAAFSAFCFVPLWRLPERLAPAGALGSSREETPIVPLWYLVPALGGLVVLATAFNGTMASMVPIGIRAGLSVSTISLVLSVSGLMGLAGTFVSGRLGSQWGAITPLVAAIVLLDAAALVLGRSLKLSGFIVGANLLICGQFFVVPYLLGDLARRDASGSSVARGQASIAIGSTAGPAAGGFLLGMYGVRGMTMIAAIVFAIAVAPFILTTTRGFRRVSSGASVP